jgi:hypothetical protein
MNITKMMITTRSKESTIIPRERLEREVKQTATLNPKTSLINLKFIKILKSLDSTLQHTLMKLMTTKAALMKAMKAIKASKMKIKSKTIIKIDLIHLQLNGELLRMFRVHNKGVTIFLEIPLKKRKKIYRDKIQIIMITTIDTALRVMTIVLQMKRMKMDHNHLLLAILLPGDYYSMKS